MANTLEYIELLSQPDPIVGRMSCRESNLKPGDSDDDDSNDKA